MTFDRETQSKLAVLLDIVEYLDKRMNSKNIKDATSDTWSACFDVKQDIKDRIFYTLRAGWDEES
jgi:hypothetical protein